MLFFAPAALAAGTGLTGEYYDNADFTSLKASRVDPTINFDWGLGSPTNVVAADTFSVRWSGQIEPRFTESYTFHLTAEDGARLWVDERLMVARTTYSAGAAEMTGRINLREGQRYNVVLEFIENSGNARVKLEWSSPSQVREVVPQSQLYPTLGLPERGSILVEHWMNLPGTNINDLTSLSAFPAHPDSRDFLMAFECLQTNWTDSYGTRVSGWVVPPTNGTYRFAVSGGDAVQLFLSADANAANRQLIASNDLPSGFRQFTNSATQVSAPKALTAGQKYYVELLHKEGTGPDHYSVAWQLPGAASYNVISGADLVPAGLDRSQPGQANYLDTLSASHPRLLASPERFEWLKRTLAAGTVPQMNTWWNSISNSASGILTQPVSVYNQDVRGTILAISRTVLDRMHKLGLVYRMTGNTNFAERAWSELQQVASTNFPDWHPAHFLDTAEMTRACSMGYDWLYDYWTQTRRDTIRTAIINKGLNKVLTLYTNNSGWVASSGNNWNLVCNGGMIMGALAIGTENQSLSEYVLYKAVASAGQVMRHYTTDNGGWYEGPGYWDYTTDYNMTLMAGLESALGSDFNLSDTKAVWETGLMPVYMVGPTKLSFNFADAGAGNMRGSQLLWLARRYDRPEYAWYERSNASADVFDLLWYDTRGMDPQAAGLQFDNYFRGPTGTTPYFTADAVTLRTRWQDPNATFIGFKAGEVGASHGHLDAGSFVLDALGVRWAHDLGGDDYALTGYFGAQRWTYYRLRVEGHNTLVINPSSGNDQVVGSKPPIILYTSEPNPERSAAIADLTSAYGVSKVLRGVQLFHNRRWALVQDEIQAASPATVWWFMHINSATTANIETNGTAVMLTQGTDRLWVKLLSGGGTFAISNAVPLPTSPNPSGQNANTGIRKLAIQLTNVTSTTLAVMMVPLVPGEAAPTNLPGLVALNDWAANTTNVAVVPTNTPPTAASGSLNTAQGASIDIDLRSFASDIQTGSNDLLFAVSAALHGAATLLSDGHTVRFVPAPGFSGLASFTYTVRDMWPDSRLLSLYNFEPPETAADGYVTDWTGHDYYGAFTTVGTGTNQIVTDTPAALAPHNSRSLLLRESGNYNGSQLTDPIPPADLEFNAHDWTFSGWFKRATSTNDDFIFYLGNSDGFGSPNEFQLYCPSGSASLGLQHYVAQTITDINLTFSGIGNGEWHHAAVTFQSTNGSSGVIKLYVDGALAGTDETVTLGMPSGYSCIFGGHASSTFQVTRWFNGELDDLGIFSAALSGPEIAQLATRPAAYMGGYSATNSLFISVLAPNLPPVLSVSNLSIIAGSPLNLQLQAGDPDSPAQDLAFRLLTGPAGATLDPVSGLLSWSTAASAGGTSNRVTVVVSEAGWHTNIPALADAYVRDGTYAAQNFGTDTNLAVKLGSAGFSREAFLKFPVPPVLGSLQAATLRLMPTSAASPGTQAVAVVANDSWGETNLTWSTKPASGAPIATWVPVADGLINLPLTSVALSEQAGDGLLSLRVYATNSAADGLVNYASREGAPHLAPALVLTSTNWSSLSATQSFWITLMAPRRPTMSVASAGQRLAISVNGDIGPLYSIQASTNLANWSTILTTNYPPQGWTDADSVSLAERFYRVVLGP